MTPQEFTVVNLTKMDRYVTGTPIDSFSGYIRIAVKLHGTEATITGTPDEVEEIAQSVLKLVERARAYNGIE